MAFSINTNLSAFQAYNALTKVIANTQKAQLRLTTGKRINSAADDTSGYRVGTDLEAKSEVKKAQLNTSTSAKNYLATAETSIDEINDLLTQISAKYTDSQDPTKNKNAIAKDINSLAGEIDSILKNTKFNGHNLLEQSDGTALASNDVFDAGGDITMDFASDSYLKVDDLNTVLNGSTTPDPGVSSYDGTSFDGTTIINGPANVNFTLKVTFDNGGSEMVYYNEDWDGKSYSEMAVRFNIGINSFMPDASASIVSDGGNLEHIRLDGLNGKNITSIATTGDVDAASLLGINLESSGNGSSTGGLLGTDTNTVLTAASDLSAVTANVKNALGRIGNLTQVVDQRSDYLSSSITNLDSSMSRLFDTDMATEQLNATKGNIGTEVGVSMLSQLNTQPQQLLSLFR